jgi:peptidoglycan hydrolase-like protein with peptidoglycan-binding domain
MKRFAVLLLVLVLCVSLSSCSKKQEALEDMQQPMSPEDLNRLKTEGQDAPGTAAPAAQAPVISTTEASLEPLPPSGPYNPQPKEIQLALKNAGYYTGPIDGKIGPQSKKAIEAFQTDNGLAADGKVGPKTWAVLSKFLAAAGAGTPTSGN